MRDPKVGGCEYRVEMGDKLSVCEADPCVCQVLNGGWRWDWYWGGPDGGVDVELTHVEVADAAKLIGYWVDIPVFEEADDMDGLMVALADVVGGEE